VRCSIYQRMGIPTVDYGNKIRQMAREEGVPDAFDFPGFVPAYIRPLFCRGVGPFRWVALSGNPQDIYRTNQKVKELLPDGAHLRAWLDMARARISFQGFPLRICWVSLGDRHRLGLAFNEMVARGEISAPIAIGRDQLDSGSVASPQSRNRWHAGWIGRAIRLAAAERAAELREWRDLGFDPSWRRSRDRLLAACRHGDRVRRHAGGSATHRARAAERSCERSYAPCRRGLRAGTGLREAREFALDLPSLHRRS
jgi:hypothetical protein